MDRVQDSIHSINKTKESWLIVGRAIRVWTILNPQFDNSLHRMEVIFMDRQVTLSLH